MPSIWHSLPPLFLLPALISAVSYDCEHVRAGKKSFHLEKLGGPKTVHSVQYQPPSITNTTFTIDLCAKLTKDRDLPNSEQCHQGTRVCAKEYDIVGGKQSLNKVIPIAGEFTASHGSNRALDPSWTRLKDDTDHPDEEGLLLELNGGKYPDTRDGVKQKAIVKLLCNHNMTGSEGFEDEDAKMLGRGLLDATSYQSMAQRRAEDDDDEDGDDAPELPDLDKDKALQFYSYKEENEIMVLRLDWQTKYACEDQADNEDDDNGDKEKSPDKNNGGSWGFFTWFLIILFLLAATYIIFGSWLNYNRYGARGWDLIPHGDTIRDIPYIMKDWAGDMVHRLKGGDSRGGYSAV